MEDLQRLRLFLEDKNPTAAVRAGHVLQSGAKRLAEFQEIGHPINDGTGRRELFLTFGAGSYVLRYIIDNETVFIIRLKFPSFSGTGNLESE